MPSLHVAKTSKLVSKFVHLFCPTYKKDSRNKMISFYCEKCLLSLRLTLLRM